MEKCWIYNELVDIPEEFIIIEKFNMFEEIINKTNTKHKTNNKYENLLLDFIHDYNYYKKFIINNNIKNTENFLIFLCKQSTINNKKYNYQNIKKLLQ